MQSVGKSLVKEGTYLSRGDAVTTKAQEKLIDAAIRIFGIYGPRGVTFDDVAIEAKVTRGSVYRLFGTMEVLFDAAVKRVLDRYFDTARFALHILELQNKETVPDALASAARQWYEELPRPAGRLLLQASLSNPAMQGPDWPIHKIIHVLNMWLERNTKQKKNVKLESEGTAKALIYSLFLLKITLPETTRPKDEREAVEGIISVWTKAMS